MKKSILLLTLLSVNFFAFGMESADNQHSNNEEGVLEEVQTSRVPMLRNLCIESLVQMEPDWEQFLDNPHYAHEVAAPQIKEELTCGFAKEQKDLTFWLSSKLKPQVFKHEKVVLAEYSDDCTQILTSCYDKTRVWDIKTGRCIQVFNHPGWDRSAVYNNEGTQQLIYPVNDSVQVWDIKANKCIQTFNGPSRFWPGHLKNFTHVWINRTNNTVLVTDSRAKRTHAFKHPDIIFSAEYNDDCTKILTRCNDNNVRVWDLTPTKNLTLEQLFLVMYLFEYHRKDSADHETLELSCANSPHLIPVFRSLDKKMQNIFKVLILSDEIVAPQEDETYMNIGSYLEGCVLQ